MQTFGISSIGTTKWFSLCSLSCGQLPSKTMLTSEHSTDTACMYMYNSAQYAMLLVHVHVPVHACYIVYRSFISMPFPSLYCYVENSGKGSGDRATTVDLEILVLFFVFKIFHRNDSVPC